ncbi:MAG: hypothetical protein E7A50_08110 [Clostridiales bacterium]|nr:hypothetical protein [Clostridiales bacterium]
MYGTTKTTGGEPVVFVLGWLSFAFFLIQPFADEVSDDTCYDREA